MIPCQVRLPPTELENCHVRRPLPFRTGELMQRSILWSTACQISGAPEAEEAANKEKDNTVD
jgi:hypothetical protein